MNDPHAELDDRLDEALEESFPASDPPAVTAEPSPSDNAEFHRFELNLYGQIAYLRYMRSPGLIALNHTQVPEELRGLGVANTLTRYALETARSEGLKVKAVCPFVKTYLEKHKEYADMVVEE